MTRLSSFVDKDYPAEDFLRWYVRTERVSSSPFRSRFTRDLIVPFTTYIMVLLILALGLKWYTTGRAKAFESAALQSVIVVENMEVKSQLTPCHFHEKATCFVGEANMLIKSESPVAVTFEGISGYLTLKEPLTPLTSSTSVGLMIVKCRPTSTAFSTARFKVPFLLQMIDDSTYMELVRNGTTPTLYLNHVYFLSHAMAEGFLETDRVIRVASYSLLDPNVSDTV